MALKFRRGSTADKSGSLAYGEPYVNTSLGTLQIGGSSGDITLATVGDAAALNVLSVSASTFVSASTLHITSNAEIKGNLTLGGNITIGDQTSDTVAVNANLSSSLIPSEANKFDLGSEAKFWRDIYVSTGSIKFVNAGGTVVSTLSATSLNSNTESINSLNSYTASNNTNISAIHTTTASLNGRVGALETKTASLDETFNTFSGSFNTYTASNNTTNNTQNSRLNAIETSTSSLNTHTASAEGRLTSLETTSGSLVSFSASVDSAIQFTGSNLTIKGDLLVKGTTTTINSTTVDIGDNIISLNGTGATNGGIIVRDATGGTTTSGSLLWDTTNDYWKAGTSGNEDKILLGQEFYIFTASNDTTNTSQNGRLDGLESFSASVNSTTASQQSAQNQQNLRLNSIETATGSLNTYTSSQDSRNTSLFTSTASLNSYTASNDLNVAAIHTATSSLNSFSASVIATGSIINTFTSSVNTFSASVIATGSIINTFTSSVNSSTSSLNEFSASVRESGSIMNTFTSSVNTSTSSLNSFSASVIATGSIINTFTSSVNTATSSLNSFTSSANGRLNSIEEKSGSFATTGSNIFQGNQTITGSLYISQDLVVAGSSSIQNISSSQLNVGTNIIKVNALNPSIRFGGLSVIDSGSASEVSGSLLFDSINDQWVYVHQAVSGAAITSSVLLMGPQSYDSLGSELYPTTNRIVKSVNAKHLGDSNITDTGTKVSINSNLEITGSVISTTSTLISSSAQITTLPSVDTDDLTEGTTNKYYLDSRVKTKLSAEGVISGSSQVYSGVSGDVVIASNGVATIQANSVALGTDTSGDYVASLVAGTNITLTNNSGEGATPTIALTNNSITIAGQSTSLGGTITAATIGNAIGAFSGSSQVSHDSTTGYSANRHVDHTAVSITAGTGLTGGGDISTTRTLSIDSTVATLTGVQTLTNKTIAAASNTISGLTNSNLSGTAGISNANLANSSVTVTAGTGMSGGGTVALGSSITLTNAGVTSNVAGTGVTVSGATGAVTISIGQAVATSSNVQFNSLGVGMAASATAGRIDATNDIVAYSSSDRRFKNNIKAIEKPLDKINKISGNTFDWNEENKIEHGYEGNDVGVIAQEIEEVLPQLVQTRENGYKAVKYDKLVALLIEGIKEQQIQINDMKVEIENLKRQKGL